MHPGALYYRGESVPFRNAAGRSVTQVWSTPGHQFAVWENDNFNYWNAQQRVLKSTLMDFTLVADDMDNDTAVTVTFAADGIHATTNVRRPAPR